MDKLSLYILGGLKNSPEWLKGKSPIHYNPTLPVNISYAQLVKDLQKNAIAFSIPQKTDDSIKRLNNFFNKTILDTKIDIAKLEKSTVDDTVKLFENAAKNMVEDVKKISREISDIVSGITPVDPDVQEIMIKRLKYKQEALKTRLASLNKTAKSAVSDFDELLASKLSDAEGIGIEKIAKILAAEGLPLTPFTGMTQSSISHILPRLNTDAIRAMIKSELKLSTPLEHSVSLGMRDAILNTNLIAGRNIFYAADELEKKFSQELQGVFRSTAYRATLIARTNIIFAENQAAYNTTKRIGAKKFLVIGSEASPECPLCPPIWGSIYDVEKDKDKVPPLHPNCLLDPQIPVFTDKGWVAIGNIKVNDLVLSHTGKFRKVKRLLKNAYYKNEVYEIHYSWNNRKQKITFTPEHPVMTKRGWVLIKNLRKKDKIQFLAKRCLCCGKLFPYFNEYEKTLFCCLSCANSYNAKKQWDNYSDEEKQNISNKISSWNNFRYGQNPDLKKILTRNCKNGVEKKIKTKGYLIPKKNRMFGKKNPAKKDDIKLKIKNSDYHKSGTWIKGLTIKNSDKIRQISDKRNQYFIKNPDKHPNRIMASKIKKGNFGYISKPQIELYEIIKKYYLDAELEYTLKINNKLRFADIAIPSLKLDIEYDGQYWHRDKEKDFIRDSEVESIGWTTLRFNKSNYKKCMEIIERVLKNHNNEYEYMFISIDKIECRQLKRKSKLYNFAVDKDESYIVKGMVTHNCRCALAPYIIDEDSINENKMDKEIKEKLNEQKEAGDTKQKIKNKK